MEKNRPNGLDWHDTIDIDTGLLLDLQPSDNEASKNILVKK